MPKITIYENDATGSLYNGDEINVFVPGNCSKLAAEATLNLLVNDYDKDTDKYKTFVDTSVIPNKAYYITGVTTSNIAVTDEETKFTEPTTALTKNVEKDVDIDSVKFKIIYNYISKTFTVYKYVVANDTDENDCIVIPAGADVEKYLVAGDDKSYAFVKDILKAGLGVVYFITSKSTLGDSDIAFLKDYNAYNVEILTMGAPKSMPTAFSGTYAKALLDLCGSRKDCYALIDCPTKSSDKMITIKQTLNSSLSGNNLSYGAAFVDWDANTEMPGSYTYLMKLASANGANKRWESISGVQRGVVNDIYTSSIIKMNKYTLDNDIQTADGISYNGICKVRPYGWTIWGDRTLLNNNAGTGLKATSFLSIRLLVCDIAKRAYNAAINNTFESNNDVTWTNYKLEIQELLDRMVASGKLADYKFERVATTKKATIACKIRIVPNEPVEDFDIYVNIENGSASITEG